LDSGGGAHRSSDCRTFAQVRPHDDHRPKRHDEAASPKPENQAIYNQLYALYRQLHDAFGGISKRADLSGVMKELIHIKEEQTRSLP